VAVIRFLRWIWLRLPGYVRLWNRRPSLAYVSAASGLYLVAEFVEEHTAITKKALRYAILSVFVLRFLLAVFEPFSFWISLLGLVALVLYYRLLQKKFPFIEFTNPMFLTASGTLIKVARYLTSVKRPVAA
jgi:hypothetical protein